MYSCNLSRWSSEVWISCHLLSVVFSLASHAVDDSLSRSPTSIPSLSANSLPADGKTSEDSNINSSHAPRADTEVGDSTSRHLSQQIVHLPFKDEHFSWRVALPPGNWMPWEEEGERTAALPFIFLLPSIILELASIGALVVFSPLIALGFAISSFFGLIAYAALL